MAGIYIHIPFCKQLCTYCDFYFSISLERKQQVFDAILLEMELRQSEANCLQQPPNSPQTLYFGGGTPSVYSPSELKQLADKAIKLYGLNNINEYTVEVNPDDLNDDYLKQLFDIGVNRLSIGIQSFIDRDLQWMRRRHSAKQAIDSVARAQKIGFNNITIDLIYGIPAMNLYEWEQNVRQALNLGVQHLSAYHLTIEPQTILGNQLKRGLFKPVTDEVSVQQFNVLKQLTSAAGFIHYEVSNFALANHYSVHNTAYWLQQPYIGFGPSAHSFNGDEIRCWNVSNNVKYLKGIEAGSGYSETETLTLYNRFNEYLLTSLRTVWGADVDYIIRNFGEQLYNYFVQQTAPFMQTGELISEEGKIRIPSKHFLVADGIISSLFWV